MVPDHEPSRRSVVASLAAVLAGCASSDAGSTTDGPSTNRTANGTATTAAPETTDSAPADGEPPESPEAAARALVTRLSAGEYEAATELFADDLAGQVSGPQLRRAWQQQVSALGEFREIAGVERRSDPPQAVVAVRVAFADGERLVRVVVTEDDAVAGLLFLEPYSPPEYADRSAFAEREVALAGVDGDCELRGTLAVPDGEGPFPGVVVVHGSGPQDRNGTIGGNRVYQDVAWGLASRGIAVLRYDKRTHACEVPPEETTLDRVVTDDALAAVETLRAADAVRSDAVAVAGHSLGGAVAPRIAARDGELAGIVMLAANARPLYRLLPEQNRYVAELDGRVTETERRRIERYEEAVRRIEEGEVDPDETIAGSPGRFWLSLREYDQVETAASLEVPRLVCQGGRDFQVSPEADFERWREALGDEATYRLYDPLNHLFAPGEGRSTPAKQLQGDNVAESVIADVDDWLADAAERA